MKQRAPAPLRQGWQPREDVPHRRIVPLRLAAFVASLALLIGLVAVLLVRVGGYLSARTEYQAYREQAAAPSPAVQAAAQTAAPSPAVQAAAPSPSNRPQAVRSGQVLWLQEKNKDAVGWLDILGTQMQFPLVQTKDNAYYVTHTFQKQKNDSGAIFVDCWNEPTFTDFNTVIYGHNMKDGSMFSGLREYRYQWFADEHSIIEITLLDKKLRYQVFAAYLTQGEEEADFRGQSCTTEEMRSIFIKDARKRAEIDSHLTVRRTDRLLTLVTCAGGDHPWFWVVHALLLEEKPLGK